MHNPLVYITGINGFVGQNLRPYLAEDFDVKGTSRKEKNQINY
jgi:nucleoside-diphosphate-sugar epimerase